MNRATKASLQLRAVDVLSMRKETRTYEELATETGIPAGDLNRYVNGHVLPGPERAQKIVADLDVESLRAELESRIRVGDDGYVDVSALVFDQPFLDLLAPVVTDTVSFERPDTILTAATDGITLGSALASHYDAQCSYAKNTIETGIDSFVEARERVQSGLELAYYLPETAIDTDESVLVVDDLTRSGGTLDLLLDIVETAGANVCGVFTLLAVSETGIDRARERTDAPVYALSTIETNES